MRREVPYRGYRSISENQRSGTVGFTYVSTE